MQQLKQIRQSGIRFLLRQNVSISFLHCFKEKCAKPSVPLKARHSQDFLSKELVHNTVYHCN